MGHSATGWNLINIFFGGNHQTREKYKLWLRIKVKDGYQKEIAGLLVLVHSRSHKFPLRRIYRGDQVHIFKYFPSVSLFDSLRLEEKGDT